MTGLRTATAALASRLAAVVPTEYAAERAAQIAQVAVTLETADERAELWADACDMLLLRGMLPHATEADCAVALADALLAWDRVMWGTDTADEGECIEALVMYGAPSEVRDVWLARRRGPVVVERSHAWGCWS